MSKPGFVYIATNKWNTVLYIGVTSALRQRISQHKSETFQSSFTKRYNINKLVYFEEFNDISSAIEREKQLKAGSRAKKVKLVETANPHWNDLADELPL